MANKQQTTQQAADRSDSPGLETIIADHVLDLLGRPKAAHRAQVRRLWDAHYRVHILIGEQRAFAAIAHSFFLSVDGAGTILESRPAITKHY